MFMTAACGSQNALSIVWAGRNACKQQQWHRQVRALKGGRHAQRSIGTRLSSWNPNTYLHRGGTARYKTNSKCCAIAAALSAGKGARNTIGSRGRVFSVKENTSKKTGVGPLDNWPRANMDVS